MKNFKLFKNYSFKSCLYNHFKRPSISLMFRKADTVMDLDINKIKIWAVFFCLIFLYFLSTNIVQGIIMPQGICKNSGVTPSAKDHQKGYEHLGKIVFPDLLFSSRYLCKYPTLYWSIVLSPVALQVPAASIILTSDKVSLGMNSCLLTFPSFHKTEHILELYRNHIQEKISNASLSNAQSSFKTYYNNSVSFKQVRNREILDHFQIIVPTFYSLEICFSNSLVKLFNIVTPFSCPVPDPPMLKEARKVREPNMLKIALQAAIKVNSDISTFKQDKEFNIKEKLQRNNVIPLVNKNKIKNLTNCLVSIDLYINTQVFQLLYSPWWVFIFVSSAFQCFSLSFEVLVFG